MGVPSIRVLSFGRVVVLKQVNHSYGITWWNTSLRTVVAISPMLGETWKRWEPLRLSTIYPPRNPSFPLTKHHRNPLPVQKYQRTLKTNMNGSMIPMKGIGRADGMSLAVSNSERSKKRPNTHIKQQRYPQANENHLPNELMDQIISYLDPLDAYFRLRPASKRFKILVEDHFRRTYGSKMQATRLSLRCNFLQYALKCKWGLCSTCADGHGNEISCFRFRSLDGHRMILRQPEFGRRDHKNWSYSASDLRTMDCIVRTTNKPRFLQRYWPKRRGISQFLKCIWRIDDRHISLFPHLEDEYKVLDFQINVARREVSVNWMVLAALRYNSGNENGGDHQHSWGLCLSDCTLLGENCYSIVGYGWERELQKWRGKKDIPRRSVKDSFPCEESFVVWIITLLSICFSFIGAVAWIAVFFYIRRTPFRWWS